MIAQHEHHSFRYYRLAESVLPISRGPCLWLRLTTAIMLYVVFIDCTAIPDDHAPDEAYVIAGDANYTLDEQLLLLPGKERVT